MTTKTITMTFPESTTRTQSQTQNIQDVGEPITLSVDTGNASYSISGRDLTVTCSNGISIRTSTEYKYDASDYRNSTDQNSFPATVPYNDGTYVGDIPKNGSPYVSYYTSDSKPASSTNAATLTWRFVWSGSSWSFDNYSSVSPATHYYDDGSYTGTLDYSSWNGANPPYPPTSAGTGHPAGYTTTRSSSSTATYTGTVTNPNVPMYRQDYYGTATRNVNWYSYNVTVTYTVFLRRPNDFAWTTAKTSGSTFNLTATEWNGLCSRIADFREYKSYSRGSYTTATTGNSFYAYMFNEARDAIAVLSASVPSTKASGNTIYASDLNQLVTALNSVT